MATSAIHKRLFFVGGNWKCNGTKDVVNKLVKDINESKYPGRDRVETVIAPTFIHLPLVSSTIRADVAVAAQNCYFESKGAFTGEVSPDQLHDLGIPWVIIGHSERRDIFKETDELIGKKVTAALKVGLKVIACLGERLEDREQGKTEEVVFRQMRALAGAINDWTNVVIAYEPVWAIGTGKTATPEIAQEVHASLRKWLTTNVNDATAQKTRIIYGGSVKGQNCADLAKQVDVDGFLVGGASLISSEFATIVNSSLCKN